VDGFRWIGDEAGSYLGAALDTYACSDFVAKLVATTPRGPVLRQNLIRLGRRRPMV
jgi:hypothetical protein